MAAGLPFLKLAGLFVKTLAKPLSSRLKIESSRNENFRILCESIGQMSHQLTSRINVFASGYKIIKVKPLPNDEARDQGVVFISESIIISLGGLVIIVEYNRGEQKNIIKSIAAAKKEAELKKILDDRFIELHNRIEDLEKLLEPKEMIKLEKLRKIRTGELPPNIILEESDEKSKKTSSIPSWLRTWW